MLARLFSAAAVALVLSTGAPALSQSKNPVRIGFSIAQTGPLSAAGKSGLLALQIWRDDVNARGGLLGRPVELVVYDDQGNPALTPGIYSKLLDVDRVDLLVAPYATNPTAPLMPLVKQRADPRIVYVQFQGIAGRSLDQFRSPGKQVIVAPDAFKTGPVRPYQQARN